MATFAEIKSDIRLGLRDQSAITDAQLGRAVNKAIRFFEPKKFWFQFANVSLDIAAGDSTITALPSDFNFYDRLSVSVTYNNIRYPICVVDIREIERGSTDNTGIPREMAWNDDVISIYPKADQAYTMNFRYYKKYAALETDNQSNDWLVDAYDLIEAKALSYLWLDNQADEAKASTYELRVAQELKRLKEITNAKRTTGNVVPDSALMPVECGW